VDIDGVDVGNIVSVMRRMLVTSKHKVMDVIIVGMMNGK
jgi:hypothetical protein